MNMRAMQQTRTKKELLQYCSTVEDRSLLVFYYLFSSSFLDALQFLAPLFKKDLGVTAI